MKVHWYSNACVRISSKTGSSVLCDPWVNKGAFLGSWFHWPPISADLETSFLEEPCNGIYISHLHPDHYDPKFLSAFSKARPEVPIYIAEFAHPWLKRSINAIAGKHSKIVEIPPLTEVKVAPDLSLKVFAADTCNPYVCGLSVPCQISPSLRGIDSVGVFTADGHVVVNANDAMGVHLIPRIAAHIGKADLLMGHYGGASPYPQCFPEVEDKKFAAWKVVEASCNNLVSAANALDANYIMPFAGQYLLGGRLTTLNNDRATIPLDDAVKFIKSISDREILSVIPGGNFDLSKGSKSSDFVEPTFEILEEYLSKISKEKFPYEDLGKITWENFENDMEVSALKITNKGRFTKIKCDNSFVIGDGEKWVTINLDSGHTETSVEVGISPKFENVTQIQRNPDAVRSLRKY